MGKPVAGGLARRRVALKMRVTIRTALVHTITRPSFGTEESQIRHVGVEKYMSGNASFM